MSEGECARAGVRGRDRDVDEGCDSEAYGSEGFVSEGCDSE